MRLAILFGQPVERYEGEYAPEPLLCWSEYQMDDNPDGWRAMLKSTEQQAVSDGYITRLMYVEVSGEKIRSLLLDTPSIKGDVSA